MILPHHRPTRRNDVLKGRLVVAGDWVAGHADDGDPPQCRVGLQIAAAVGPGPVLDLTPY